MSDIDFGSSDTEYLDELKQTSKTNKPDFMAQAIRRAKEVPGGNSEEQESQNNEDTNNFSLNIPNGDQARKASLRDLT